MERTVSGLFSTRRDAELAVEHVVQEHGVDRDDVFIKAMGTANSAGAKAAGSDTQSGHPGVKADGTPALAGEVEVSVDCHEESKVRAVRAAFERAGGHEIRMY